MKKRGKVFLVGAGPGDPELLTVKAIRMLEAAQAVLYDRLVSDAVLALIPEGAISVPVGKAPGRHPVPQEEINALLVELALDGLTVVRLKGGDPLVFGRGSEEVDALSAAGIPVEIAPGITAAQGAASVTGVPLTHRGLATGVRFVTGHCRDDRPLTLDWAGMADPETTLVVYMGAAHIGEIAAQLIGHGLSGAMPVMAVANVSGPGEWRLVSRLDRIADDLAGGRPPGPVLFVIGHVVSLYQPRADEILAHFADARDRESVHV